MPKMFVHTTAGTFDATARAQVAAELTALGLACERLPDTPFVRSTIWVYFAEYARDGIFSGGEPASAPLMSLQVYVLEGGLDAAGQQKLIADATVILGRNAKVTGRVPAYVVIHEVPAHNWGMFGETGSIEPLRLASPETSPI